MTHKRLLGSSQDEHPAAVHCIWHTRRLCNGVAGQGVGLGLGLAFLTSWAKLHIASLCPLLSSSWKISVVLLFSVSGLESRHWHVIGCSTHQACPPRPGQPRRRHRQTWARLPPQRRAVWNEDADEEFGASAPRRAYLSIVLANGRGDAGTRQSGRGLNSVDSTVEPDERANALGHT